MNRQNTSLASHAADADSTPAPGLVLRRKCACGTHTIGGGECEGCNNNRTLRRRASRAAGQEAGHAPEHTDVPQVVHEVLRSPGHSLDANVRALLEPRFGHDFSRVRVHTDAKASESAAAVSAVAYTVGRDIVFAGGQYAPHTSEGRGLLAHELTHVAQNADATADTSAPIRVGPAVDRFESEADRHAEAAVLGAPAHGAVSHAGEPGRLSRATYTYGKTKVEVNYGNVINTPGAKMEAEIESLFTTYTGSAAKAIHKDLAKLDVYGKEWVLFALDLLMDNPVAGLDKVEAVRRLIAHAPTTLTRPTGSAGDGFVKEALSVSGWFEKALTSGLAAPTGTDLADVETLLKRPSGGSACPPRKTASEKFDGKKLESDLPGELTKYLKKVLVPKSPSNRAMAPMLPIGDAIQSHARKFYAPFADKSRGGGNTFLQQWKYSAHASSTQTTAGAPNKEMRLSYLDSRARKVADEGGLFTATNFDSRCAGDEVVLKGIVEKMEKDAAVLAILNPILEQKSFTKQDATPKEVFINTRYEAKADECAVRWDMVKSMCHELMHVMVHDDFKAAIGGRGVLNEGFPEVLGHYLYEDIGKDSKMRKSVESGLTGAPCASVPPSKIGYNPFGPQAETIRGKVGDANFRAAFFLGQLSLAGIQPKRADGDDARDPHEAEAETASRAVAESRAVGPSLRRAPSVLDSDDLHAGTGRPLEPRVRSEMESRFGHDFSGVRVHTDARAQESARSLNALAYTVGGRIAFGAGQYAPDTHAGRRLLAHELTHTIQQGHAAPSNVGGLGLSRPQDSSEAEADRTAEAVVRGSQVPGVSRGAAGVIQRTIEMRDVGRGQASGFARLPDLIQRLNAISQGLTYSLDAENHLAYEERAGGTLSDFDRQMMDFIDQEAVIPLRLTNNSGRTRDPAGAFTRRVLEDEWQSAYVDIEDLLASDDLALQTVLAHFIRERSETRNYARRIGTASLDTDLPAPRREFLRVHDRGIESEAAVLRGFFGDPTIRFVPGAESGNIARVFRNDRGDRIRVRVRTRRGVDALSVNVRTRDGRTLTAEEYRQLLEAERAAAAAPAAAPAVPAAPGAP